MPASRLLHTSRRVQQQPRAWRCDIDNANHGGVRIQLRWLIAEGIEATTRADYSLYDEAVASYDHLLVPECFRAAREFNGGSIPHRRPE